MSKTQEKLLADHFGQFVLMLDGDEAGRRATEEIAERLQRVVFRVDTVELDEGVQPTSAPAKQSKTSCAPSSDGAFYKSEVPAVLAAKG